MKPLNMLKETLINGRRAVTIEEVEAKFCVIRYSGGNLNKIEDQ